MPKISQSICLIVFLVLVATTCMGRTVVNQTEVDDNRHHTINKRACCACFGGTICPCPNSCTGGSLCIGAGCGDDDDTTTTSRPTARTSTTDARCDAICVGRRRTTADRCPACYSGASFYAGGYYCCGGATGATCGGLFAGTTCACRYTSSGTGTLAFTGDCVAYDGGCGYFSSIDFDGACGCFTCGK
jgi:hypothetical protein